MMSDAQAELVCFIKERGHYVAIDSENLYSVSAHLLDLSNARSSFVGVARRRRITEHRVDQQARRGDFGLRAVVAERQGLFCIASYIANGGDAAREPELQTVVNRLRDAGSLVLNVAVRIDQAGQNILARRVDFDIALRAPGPAIAKRDRIERDDLGNPVVL